LIGHDLSKEEILERVNSAWNLSGAFPVPKCKVKCPVCRSNDIFIKQCVFFKRKENDYRADVSFKCTYCSAVWTHGVVVPEKMAKPMKGSWSWRKMREVNNGIYKNMG
jgi:hypothetical protein